MQRPDREDPALWEVTATQLGLHGLVVPERYGGAGFGLLEQAIVIEELGRACAPGGYLSSVGIAGSLLLATKDEPARERLLPDLATGNARYAWAWASRQEPVLPVGRAAPSGAAWVVSGTARGVLGGAEADQLLVLAESPDGPVLLSVAARQPAVTAVALTTLDLTRAAADLELVEAGAALVAGPADVRGVLRRGLDAARVLLCAEQVGGTQRCLDDAVAYAKVRRAVRATDRVLPGRQAPAAPTCCVGVETARLGRRLRRLDVSEDRPARRRSGRHVLPTPTARGFCTCVAGEAIQVTAGSASPGSTTRTCSTGGRAATTAFWAPHDSTASADRTPWGCGMSARLPTNPRPGVARIVLARPEARNAQDTRLLYELNDAFDRPARTTTPSRSSSWPPTVRTSPPATTCATTHARQRRLRAGRHLVRASTARARRAQMAREQEIYLGFCWRWRNLAQADHRPGPGQGHRRRPDAGVAVRPHRRRRRRRVLRPGRGVRGQRGRVLRARPASSGARRAKEMLFTGHAVSARRAATAWAWSTAPYPPTDRS